MCIDLFLLRTKLELISELPDLKQLRYCNLKSHESINRPIVVKMFDLSITLPLGECEHREHPA